MIGDLRIVTLQYILDLIDLILDLIRIDHRIIFVMIMSVMRNAGMIVFQSFRMGRIFMMLCRMDQDIKACPFSGRNRNNRDSQHFRKTVQVDLHAPFFHDIHHI